MKLTFGLSLFSRGDTTNTNLQNMEPVSEEDQEPIPEDLGKLTVVDKARTGRVSLKMAFENKNQEPSSVSPQLNAFLQHIILVFHASHHSNSVVFGTKVPNNHCSPA